MSLQNYAQGLVKKTVAILSKKILFGHSRFPRVRFSARIDLEF